MERLSNPIRKIHPVKEISLNELINKVESLKRLEEEGINVRSLLNEREREIFERIDSGETFIS